MKPTKRSIALQNMRALIDALSEHRDDAMKDKNETWASMLDVVIRAFNDRRSHDIPDKQGRLMLEFDLSTPFASQVALVDDPPPALKVEPVLHAGGRAIWLKRTATRERLRDRVRITVTVIMVNGPYATVELGDGVLRAAMVEDLTPVE